MKMCNRLRGTGSERALVQEHQQYALEREQELGWGKEGDGDRDQDKHRDWEGERDWEEGSAGSGGRGGRNERLWERGVDERVREGEREIYYAPGQYDDDVSCVCVCVCVCLRVCARLRLFDRERVCVTIFVCVNR
jgi:hypothetical protein